jgi:hypothetical protein
MSCAWADSHFQEGWPNCTVFYRVFPGKVTLVLSCHSVPVIFELTNESIDKIAIRLRSGERISEGSFFSRGRDFSGQRPNRLLGLPSLSYNNNNNNHNSPIWARASSCLLFPRLLSREHLWQLVTGQLAALLFYRSWCDSQSHLAGSQETWMRNGGFEFSLPNISIHARKVKNMP